MKKVFVLSISFGKDSLALLLELLRRNYPLDIVIFYDTGKEFDAIYQIEKKIAGILAKKGIRYVRLMPDIPFDYYMFDKPVCVGCDNEHLGYGWCGGPCRWGTALKTEAINKFYDKEFPDCMIIEYIGIATDEPERVIKSRSKRGKTIQLFSLVEWQMTENDCLVYCIRQGYNWIENGVFLYQILDRVSCWCCGNKNLKELRNIFHFLPQYWERLKEAQRRITRPFKKNMSIFDLEKRFIAEDLGQAEELKEEDLKEYKEYEQLELTFS